MSSSLRQKTDYNIRRLTRRLSTQEAKIDRIIYKNVKFVKPEPRKIQLNIMKNGKKVEMDINKKILKILGAKIKDNDLASKLGILQMK